MGGGGNLLSVGRKTPLYITLQFGLNFRLFCKIKQIQTKLLTVIICFFYKRFVIFLFCCSISNKYEINLQYFLLYNWDACIGYHI